MPIRYATDKSKVMSSKVARSHLRLYEKSRSTKWSIYPIGAPPDRDVVQLRISLVTTDGGTEVGLHFRGAETKLPQQWHLRTKTYLLFPSGEQKGTRLNSASSSAQLEVQEAAFPPSRR